jgi:hypothetical protein
MSIGAIGAVSGIGYGSLAALTAMTPADTTALSRLASLPAASLSLDQFITAIDASGLAPSSKVSLSEAAQALFSLNGNDENSRFGEFAQALIVALILQLLSPGGSS